MACGVGKAVVVDSGALLRHKPSFFCQQHASIRQPHALKVICTFVYVLVVAVVVAP